MMHWSLLVIACDSESPVCSVILGLTIFINCLTGFFSAKKRSKIMMLGHISMLFIVIIAMICMTTAMAVVISNNPSRLHVEEVDKCFELKDLFVPLLGIYIAYGENWAWTEKCMIQGGYCQKRLLSNSSSPIPPQRNSPNRSGRASNDHNCLSWINNRDKMRHDCNSCNAYRVVASVIQLRGDLGFCIVFIVLLFIILKIAYSALRNIGQQN